MFSRPLNWMRQKTKSARFKYAVVFSFLALVVVFGVVQASGPMRPPHPPMGGMWGPPSRAWWPTVPVPTIKIIAVTKDQNVTFETTDFPENEDFTVTMGYMYTRGVNGYVVGTFNSGDGGTFQQTFDIPAELQGQYRISIRTQTAHTFPYYSYNWFYNNSTNGNVTTTSEAPPAEGEAAEVPPAEGEAAEAPPAEGETTETPPAEGEAAETPPAEGEAGMGGAASLTGAVWNWVEFTDAVEGTTSVDNPEQYKVEFLPEGGLNIQADCNVGNGTYEASDDGSITITIGAMTLALCAPESRSDEFVNHLGSAAVYFFEEGSLYIDLFADGGTMKLTAEAMEAPAEGAEPAEEAAPAEGESTDEAPAEGETEGEAPAEGGSEGEAPADGGTEESTSEESSTGTVEQAAVASINAVNGTVVEEVPSFTICAVEKDSSVFIVTENFPADQVFQVKMGVMPHYPKAVPYYDGMMMPPMGPGQDMGMPQGQKMPPMGPGQDMGMPQGQQMPPMGNQPEYPMPMPPMDYSGGMYKPMNPPMTWIPYYEAGSLESGEGGSLTGKFEIPAELAGAYRISIMLRTDHAYPYYAYNWFYNNTAEVCD